MLLGSTILPGALAGEMKSNCKYASLVVVVAVAAFFVRCFFMW